MLGKNLGIEDITVSQNRVPVLTELAFLWGKEAENKNKEIYNISGSNQCYGENKWV